MSQKSKKSNISLKWSVGEPYQTLPLLPPKVDLESKVILKACIKARAELAELKKAAELIPNQSMLISVLPVLEARASSEIENILTTTDRLFQFTQIEDKADPATKEGLRYSRALLKGFEALKTRPLNTGSAEQICTTIKNMEMRVRKVPGTQLINGKTGEIVYTPPIGEDHLRKLLKNWEDFLHGATDLDPLIRLAVGHYQFEAIHPFADGNGRTGRIINSLFLIQEGLLTLPILYLSKYLIKEKDEYYKLLSRVTNLGEWENWILFILKGIEQTSTWTREKIDSMKNLMDHTRKYIQNKAPKMYSYELVSIIFDLPYCRIQNLTDNGLVGRQAASRYLKKLVQIGVLNEVPMGREKLFVHPKLLQLLSDNTHSYKPYQK